MQRSGAALQRGGRALDAAGKTVRRTSSAASKGGAAATKGGAGLSKTGIGAVAGVPVAAVGAATKAFGFGGKAAGAGTQAAGKASRAAGTASRVAGKAATAARTRSGQGRPWSRPLRIAGRLRPVRQVRRVAILAVVLLVLAGLIAVTAGSGTAGLPSAVPAPDAREELGDTLSQFEQAGTSELVPWPILAGIAWAATRNGTFDPYTGRTASGLIAPPDDQPGGVGPLLLSPQTIAATGVNPHDRQQAARAAAARLSEQLERMRTQGRVSTDQLVALAGFNRNLISDAELGAVEGTRWHDHITLWRDVVSETPDLVALPFDGACMVDLGDGYSVPQQIQLAFRCAIGQAGGVDIRDPQSGATYDPTEAAALLAAEAVQVSFKYSQWGDVDCDLHTISGGVFPIPVGERIMETDPDTGEEVWTGQRTYDRCDPVDNIRRAADMVVEREAVPFDDRPGDQWARHAHGWSVFRDALGVAATADDSPRSRNQFLRQGPMHTESVSDECANATTAWVSATLENPKQLPAGLSFAATSDAGITGTIADGWVDQLDTPADELVRDSCGQPRHDDGVIDYEWALFARETLQQARNRLVFPVPSEYAPRVDGLDAWLTWSVEGGDRIEPRWGHTSAVPRLSNPPVAVDVPSWTAPGQQQFADQVVAAALAFIGECEALPSVTAGTVPAGAGAPAGGALHMGSNQTLDPELYSEPDIDAAVQAAYNVGLRGDALVLAVAVAGAESGFRAVFDNGRMDNGGPLNSDGSVDYGLWQINGRWWDISIPEIYDAAVNAEWMDRISKGGTDWTAWVAYTNGSYQGFLEQARNAVQRVLGAGATLPGSGSGAGPALPVGAGPSSLMSPTGGATLCGPSLGSYHIPPTGASGAWGGHANGRIPVERLCRVSDGSPAQFGDPPASLLECNAAQAFVAMHAAYQAHFGRPMDNVFGYRNYEGQVATAIRNCGSAQSRSCDPPTARPGTSNHGWGLAVDMTTNSCGTNNRCGFATDHFAWLQANAPRFGFFHPEWAQQSGSATEYWHWEFPAPTG